MDFGEKKNGVRLAFVVVRCLKIIQSQVTAFPFGILTSIEMATASVLINPRGILCG